MSSPNAASASAARQANRADQRCFVLYDAHAPSTTARGGLDDDRVADLAGHAQIIFRFVAEWSVRSGDAVGTPAAFIARIACDLVTHRADDVRLAVR